MGAQATSLRRGLLWLWEKITVFLDFVCAFSEIHLVKIVSFSIMAMCCTAVNALHLIVVSVLLLCIAFGLSALRFSFSFIGIFLSGLFLTKMLYQTKFIPELNMTIDCATVNDSFQTTIQLTILDPVWWGYKTLNKNESLMSCYNYYIVLLVVMTLQSVIKIRQKIARIDAGKSPDTPPVLYIQTTRKDADMNLKECFKYLINYGFYKFGIEITLSYCVFTIAYRMDVFSVLYALWLTVLFLPQRSTLYLMWPFFLTTLIFSILWQYCMAVGLSNKACFQYPWSDMVPLTIWLFLPSFEYPPSTAKTLVDFVLLLLIQRQQSVFELERRYGSRFIGGSNKIIYMDYYSNEFINPTPDHTGSIRSWLDVLKFLFMSCLFRITLAFTFWNGASNANILSLGYLVGSFVFLWIDYDLCLWHITKILKWWNFLLGYAVFVIFLKSLLQLCACVYSDYLNSNVGWLVQLLFLKCSFTLKSDHSVVRSTSNIFWDVFCFVLLIFQRRYFQSYYFLHEVDDFLGIFSIQAKGAKLMDELQEKKLKEFQLRERKTLMKIKKNMNRIKAWQKRMQGLNYNEPTDHATAIYMGDYLMFEDLNEVTSKLDESSTSSDEYDYDEDGEKSKKEKDVTMSEFIGTVFLKAADDSLSRLPKKKEADHSEAIKGDGNTSESPTSQTFKVKETENDVKGYESEDFKKTRTTTEEKINSKSTWKLFHSFLDSVMVSMIRFFNKHSRDYRYIQAKMKAERRKQKQQLKKEGTVDSQSKNLAESSMSASRQKYNSQAIEKERASASSDPESENISMEGSYKKSSQALLVKLINSICTFIMSKTELLCFIIIFLHTALSPTLISLPLPLLVFFWGSLTTIRPTTTFWTVLIAYTEITVVIKALFQNSIFPWNDPDNSMIRPEYPPLFLGIHRNNQYVIADLFLLLLLFLHRYKLKTLGLWNRTHEEETILPQNLKVYKELPSETDFKDVKGNRSLVHQRKRLISELTDANDSIAHFLQMATWKCTSRATGKLVFGGNKIRTKIRVKEIEGHILVTHEGRRLEPTFAFVTQLPEESLEGNVVLRVYVNDIVPEARSLLYRLSWIQHFTPLRKFFIQILVRDWRVSSDFYTLMFVFEFLNFLIIFFGYSSFTDSVTGDTEEYFSLAENQVPAIYLVMMIIHFIVIIIDRILYLRKNVVGKLVLQFILVILVHIWMFVIVPIMTESPFNLLIIPQMYYMMSCFYFLMSAYQLRVGYPLRVQGHFLCKKYGYVNYYAYKGLQLIPFFNQLRILLDFICIQSSLTMTEWIKMESIFQLVYENKCSRRADIVYPVPRGQDHIKCAKITPGIFVLIGIVIVIWLPFIIFALFNTVAQPNLPQEASIKLEIGNFGQIYSTKATFTDIIKFSESNFRSIHSIFKDNKKVWTLLSLFDNRDVAAVKFRSKSYEPWSINSEELAILNSTVHNLDIPIILYLIWEIKRIPRFQILSNSRGYREITLTKNDDARSALAEAFDNKSTLVHLKQILPKFIQVTNDGSAKPLSGFLGSENRTNPYRNVTFNLEGDGTQLWWNLVELADDEDEQKIVEIPYQSDTEITIYTFNEKNIPKLLLNISKRGIIGLYLSIVLVTWTFIRRLMWKYPYIMFEDMPNPDEVLKLCHDIYLARESHEFELEEDLYAKLLFLFRSPETMIKVTRLSTMTQAQTE